MKESLQDSKMSGRQETSQCASEGETISLKDIARLGHRVIFVVG